MTEHVEAQRQLMLTGYDLGAFRVLEVVGECDVSTETDLWSALVDAITVPADALILDLSRLTFCDRTCADLMLAVGSAYRLVLCGVSGVVARVFDFLDPTHKVARHPNVDSAAWSLSGLPDPWQ